MSVRPGLFSHMRASALPAACMLIALYFAYHAIASDTGLLAWGGYKAERAALEEQSRELAARRAGLEHKVALLDPARVDPDLADELVRENLGVVRPDEVVIPLTRD